MNFLEKTLFDELYGFDYFWHSLGSNINNINYKIEKKNNENEKILSITVYVPGFSKEDLELNIKNNNSLLELSYKKGNETKRFHSFTLAQEYDVSKLEAECKNGLLTIKIPEKLQITKKIEIK